MNNIITTLADTEFYLIKLNETLSANKLYWKRNNRLNINQFKNGIIDFAVNCKLKKPKKAVIDARQLDQKGTPYLWVSGQIQIDDNEDYNFWWGREVAPILNDSKILGLGVATGDPFASGELINLPEVAKFRIGYFTTFDEILDWKLN